MGESMLRLYVTRMVKVKVADLLFPSLKVRPTRADNAAIAQFVTQFAAGNYGIGNRTICVGIDPTCEATVEEVIKAIEESKETGTNCTLTALKNVRVLVVDGAHRVEAFRAPRSATSCPVVTARVTSAATRSASGQRLPHRRVMSTT